MAGNASGEPPCSAADHIVTPSSSVLRAVLAALALAGTAGLPAGELFETVWGSRVARSMDSTLTVSIHRLRKWLRRSTDARVSVTRTTTGYALNLLEGEVDAQRFLRLAEASVQLEDSAKADTLGAALALWRGPALADVPDGSSDRAAVIRLELRRITVVVEYARTLLRTGRAEQAVQVLSRAVESHPLDERVIGTWIEALAATGRQADALDAYERLRLRLRDEMGTDPGRALSQALTRVLRHELAPARQEEPRAQSPARWPVLIPAQLPADQIAFTGRTDALARLDALRRNGSSSTAPFRIAILTGAGGVGKTALAVHWAHRSVESFPDGQFYANLHGFSASPPEQPIDVLGRFLRALGVTGPGVPADLDEAGALYRSLLVGRRVLVVLDNAADPAQVRPLLPGAETCRVLVTSRDRLDGLVALDGALPIGLDVLSERDSADLLARLLGEARARAGSEAVRDLVRACARLPLALRIAAAQLVLRPKRSIAEFAAQLAGDRRLDSLALDGDELSQVRAVFDLSYARLDPPARRMLRAIGAIPEIDLTPESAAVLLGDGVRDAQDTLDRLASVHLVTAHLPGRYECHDLLRAYAAERARIEDSPRECEAVARRLCDWYRGSVERAVDFAYPDRDRLPEPERPDAGKVLFEDPFRDPSGAMAWLRAEHRNVLAVVGHCADRGPRSNAWRLAWALRPHVYATELHVDWFTAVSAAERALAREPDVLGMPALDLMLGDVAQLRGQSSRSLEYYVHAIDSSREAGWLVGAAAAHLRLGLEHFGSGALADAKSAFRQSLESYREAGEQLGALRAMGNLGLVHCDTGPLRTAIKLLTHFDRARAEIGVAGARGQSLCALGYAHWRAGDFEQARRLLEQALELSEQTGEARVARLAHCDLVALHCELGDHARARYHAALAESLGKQAATPRALTQTAYAWAKIHEGERNYERALKCYSEVVRAAIEHGDAEHHMIGLVGVAAAHRALGAAQEALHKAQQALAMAHERGARVFETEALVELAETHLALGNPGRARQHAERAAALGAEVGRRLAEARALRALGDALRRIEGEQSATPHWRAAHALFAELGSAEARSLTGGLRAERRVGDPPPSG
jgi:DNA-binding SARP family transcriptional activator